MAKYGLPKAGGCREAHDAGSLGRRESLFVVPLRFSFRLVIGYSFLSSFVWSLLVYCANQTKGVPITHNIQRYLLPPLRTLPKPPLR